ncbi:MAG: right-handed parallel beta-helix repeat-containing protein, partial [Candidatus Hodarchaeales archaeon]
NQFHYQGFASIGIYYSNGITFSDNIVRGSSFGVLLETSQNNLIERNEIFETETGISLNNKAGNNRVRQNILHDNNQGIFITNDPYPVVDLWPNQYIFATDSDSIKWQAIQFEMYSEYPIDEVHDELLQVILTVDGVSVDTSFSEVYFDGEQLRFDITYLSEPLSVGEHEFAAQFIIAGEIGWQPIAHVTVTPTPSVRNFIILNTLYDNFYGIILQNANDNIVAVNTLTNNFGEGIGVYGSSNNRIVFNQIEYSGWKGIMVAHDFGWDVPSKFNTIANNTIFGGAQDGVSLEWVSDNLVEDNEIFDNQWAGVRLFGTSSYNDIVANTIHNNWGGGIAFESYSDMSMRFWQDVTATEADHISWQASVSNESFENAQIERDLTTVSLTVDDQPVEVWFSEVYFDDHGDPEWPRPWRFDMDYYSEPLTVGEHEFHVEFFRDGILQEEWTRTAIVTVEPATDENYVSHNNIIGNEIFGNDWSGINVWKAYNNLIMDNQIYWHYGDGIHIADAENNVIDFNTIFENDVGIGINSADNNILTNNDIYWNNWNGIRLSGTASGNSITNNIIHQNWGGGINIESHSDVFMPFYPTFILGIPIIATEADSISFHATRGNEDEAQAWYEYYNLEIILTVDGERVEVWYSEPYWDDWTYPNWPYPWHFSIDSYVDPLPTGVHEFTVQFILEGELIQEETAYVTIISATDDDYTSHNYISNNEIFENGWTGINIWRSHNNVIDTNTISNNGGQGIWIGESRSNEILNNVVEFSGADSGVNLYYSYDHFISGNTITTGFSSGFFGAFFGILLEESNGNIITDNLVFDTEGPGIQLFGTSSHNTILGNTIHHNGMGIGIDSYTEVQMRFWQDVTATDVDFISWQASILSEDWMEILEYRDFTEVVLIIDGEQVDIWFSDIYFDEGNWQYRFDMDYHSNPLPVGTHEFYVEFYFHGDLVEEWTSASIVTVVPATDENYASHNTISSNDIFEFQWIGINLFRSRYNYIEENTITANFDVTGKGFAGIRLESSSYNTITENEASGCKNGGILLVFSSDYNSVIRNRLFGHGKSGMFVWYSNFNELSHNILFENGWDGIGSLYSNSNEYRSNIIFNNPRGITLQYSSDSIITHNFLQNNVEAGIYLVDDSSGNMISRNTVYNCGNAGIALLGGSNDNNVHRNLVMGNYFGILLDSVSFTNVYRNIVFNNEEGVCVSYSSHSKISRNVIFSNEIGIHVIESGDTELFRNELFSNVQDIVEEP